MTTTPAATLRLGTRKSALARWQTDHIRSVLSDAHPGLACADVTFETTGDRSLDEPLTEIGGKGLFTAELERALLECRIDVAVHSLKDLPTEDLDGLVVGAIPERADPRDVFVSVEYGSFSTLPDRGTLGTSSPRRAAQALRHRPDLRIESIRGNVDTRIRKALERKYDGILLAAAGLTRLGMLEHATEFFDLDFMLPAPGQGALAIQCRADDEYVRRLLAPLEHPATRAATVAERAFLRALGGGCSAPIAAHARADAATANLSLVAIVAATDGSQTVRVEAHGSFDDAEAIGTEAAASALRKGAGAFLP